MGVRFIILVKTGKETNKKFYIDLAYIMNILFNGIREFFNITPGVANQRVLITKEAPVIRII